MKLFVEHRMDERMRSNTRYAAAIWLFVTQILLAGVIFFRLYVQGQPDSELRDFQAVLAISIFGHIALQLLVGGVLRVPTATGLLIGYLGLAGIVTAGCLIVYGVPPLADWKSTWLPALAGPAIFVGLYWVVALAGRWRLERQIDDD